MKGLTYTTTATGVRLTADLHCVPFHGCKIDVPKGFECDGASIPRWAWSFVGSPFQPDILRAAVVHDYLYRTGSVGSRSIADAIFRKMMLDDGVGFVRRQLIYFAVRCWGRYFYNASKA